MLLRKEVIILFLLQHVGKCSSYMPSTSIDPALRGFHITTTVSQKPPRPLRLPSFCKSRVASHQRCSFIKTDATSTPASSILFPSYSKQKAAKKVRAVTTAGSTVSPNNGNDDRPLLQRVFDMFRNFILSFLKLFVVPFKTLFKLWKRSGSGKSGTDKDAEDNTDLQFTTSSAVDDSLREADLDEQVEPGLRIIEDGIMEGDVVVKEVNGDAELTSNMESDAIDYTSQEDDHDKKETIVRITGDRLELLADEEGTGLGKDYDESLVNVETPSMVPLEDASKDMVDAVASSVIIQEEEEEKEETVQEIQLPKGERWAVSSPEVNLTGKWKIIASDDFKKDYDLYLKNLGQPSLVRSIAVSIVDMTTEEVIQLDNGRSLSIKGKNLRGVWDRTLLASGSDVDVEHGENDEHTKISLVTADKENVEAESWWEKNGTVHRSWLRGVKKYGGGDFESRRYLADGGKKLVCESVFHPQARDKENAVITWVFERVE